MFSSLKAPLCVYYSDISDMIKVVESICPLKSSISLVSDPGIPFVKLHSQDLDKKVTYYGKASSVVRFMEKLNSDKTHVSESGR